MSSERREFPRFVHPIEGTWRGASGASSCRVGDLSLGGCFVYSVAQPLVGEETMVTMALGEHLAVSVKGTVVSCEAAMGFSVKFSNPSALEMETLTAILEQLRAIA